jgi:hypothetical protein
VDTHTHIDIVNKSNFTLNAYSLSSKALKTVTTNKHYNTKNYVLSPPVSIDT